MPEPIVRVTEHTVSLLPGDDHEAHTYAITVQYRGEGRWAVVRYGSCLGRDGTWARGMIKPHDRGDAWLDAHRFTEAEALRMAREAAPGVTVNGVTAAQAAARRTAGGAR